MLSCIYNRNGVIHMAKPKDTRNQNMIIYKLWDVIICVIIASFRFNNTWEEIHDFVEDNYKWLTYGQFLKQTYLGVLYP